MNKIWLTILLLVTLSLVGGYLLYDYNVGLPKDVERHYVGRNVCITCHQEQADLFSGSHHDLAMDVANEETVLAEFDHTLTHHGLTSRMYRDGERFMVRTDGPDGEMTDFEVKYVLGVHPLQQYMVEIPQADPAKNGAVGRLQVLRESWDVENKRWFYLNPPDVDEKLRGDDPLHWTGVTQRWNNACAKCHSTNLEKNYSIATQSFHTTFSEIDVSCEACHGPGSLHVELATANSPFWDKNHGYGLVKLKTESNVPQVEMCATCHSRRRELRSQYVAGQPYDEHFACNLVLEPIYHADGQIRYEDYVYGSFKQSKMYHKGIKCTDCHDPHSAKVKFKGNELCTSCHQHPAGKYDSPLHHHHEVGSPGSLCVECHMPETTYMSIDPRRDHSLRVPRPDMSVKYSTPNACTKCHLDSSQLSVENQNKVQQYRDWFDEAENGNEEIAKELNRVDSQMAEAVRQWYGETSPSRTDSYYERLAEIRGAKDPKLAADLIKDRDVPFIVRASAAIEIAEDESPETLEAALEVLDSRDASLVSAALQRVGMELTRLSVMENPDAQQLELRKELAEAVVTAVKSDQFQVRIAAAFQLVQLPAKARRRALQSDETKFNDALAELEKSQLMDSDSGGSHRTLALIYESLGDFERAEKAYRTAMQVAPTETGPRSNLAALLEAKSEQSRQMMMRAQQQGASALELQRMFQEVSDMIEDAKRLQQEEHELLARDIIRAEGLKDTHELHYRYAMSCYNQNQLDLVEKHLKIACEQQPDNQRYLLGLASYYEVSREFDKGLEIMRRLKEMDSENLEYKRFSFKLQTLKEMDEAKNNDD